MRTRLDEIIEEALGKDAILDIHAYAAAKLIAHGAFRHGVEQAHLTNKVGAVEYKGWPWIWDVTPAPAAEKPYWIKFDGGTATRMEDRRVGQRRRPDPPPRRGTVSEYKTTGISTNDVYTYNTTGSRTFWGTDRRSGKERRTTKG